MARQQREKSQTGIYHVMLRGINQQNIFDKEEDKQKFLEVLEECKAISEYKIFAYCLMNNHVHVLIKEGKEDLGQIIKRIGVRYVHWYNRKNCRRGHLFQDRYRSEPIENDGYFLTVLRYIHQNPLKAGIIKNMSTYPYSSYVDYVNVNNSPLTDTKYALDMIGIKEFIRFHSKLNEDKCMDDNTGVRVTDIEAREIIKKVSGCIDIEQFLRLSIDDKNKYIKLFKNNGISIRQIVKLTGVSFGVVRRI